MTPAPRARARRRKPSPLVTDAGETTAPMEEPMAEPPPASNPTIIDTTATVIAEEIQPLVLAPEPESARTDFYFPPLPRSEPQAARQRTVRRAARARRAARRHRAQAATRITLRLLKGLARTIQILAVFTARGFRRLAVPTARTIWHWLVDDPYAPPRERPEQAILQGRVLCTYRYRLYQRIILNILGGIPLTIALLYLCYLLVNGVLYGIDGRLFLVQDVAGACAGLFSSLMLLSLASTRITLRSDGIEYKTMFRVVRSRWEEISMLKVDYFRKSERWVVGTGRGAWAFLHHSLFGLPKGRQLAKLITIYARLSPTGTPYWLPSLGRFAEQQANAADTADSGQRPAARSTARKARAPMEAQQQAP